MCLVLECCTGFLVRFIALVLSHLRGILERLRPKSLCCCLIHDICTQHLPAAIYSSSAVERATQAFFFTMP